MAATLRVLLLGGTGSIGSAVLRELVGRGHRVLALARSDASASKAAGPAAVICGGIEALESWAAALPPVGAAVRMVCDFGGPMAATDRICSTSCFPGRRRVPAGRASSTPADAGGWVPGRPHRRSFARRFGTPKAEPEIVTADAVALELGEWARGYALDQRLSGAKARRELGWTPKCCDPEGHIAGWDLRSVRGPGSTGKDGS